MITDYSKIYQDLSRRIALDGVRSLLKAEIVELEELNQLRLKGSLEEKGRDIALKQIEKEAKTRVAEGKSPFERPALDRWDWDGKLKKYHWHRSPAGQNEPKDYQREEDFFWEPTVLREQKLGPEGNQQSKL